MALQKGDQLQLGVCNTARLISVAAIDQHASSKVWPTPGAPRVSSTQT